MCKLADFPWSKTDKWNSLAPRIVWDSSRPEKSKPEGHPKWKVATLDGTATGQWHMLHSRVKETVPVNEEADEELKEIDRNNWFENE